jgi:NADPH:quinone reductase-like Zn-dependent oxidoreductase
MGADHVIDYTKEDVLSRKEDYDIFLDAVASQSFITARRTLKPGGVYITTVPTPLTEVGPLLNMLSSKKVEKIMVKSSHQDLEALRKIVDDGGLAAVIEKVYPMADVSDAHRRSESGRVVGKLVLKMT